MNVQFYIHKINPSTGQQISGSLFSADNEHIFDLFDELKISPANHEFEGLPYLEFGRKIRFEGEDYEVVKFTITAWGNKENPSSRTLGINILVKKIE